LRLPKPTRNTPKSPLSDDNSYTPKTAIPPHRSLPPSHPRKPKKQNNLFILESAQEVGDSKNIDILLTQLSLIYTNKSLKKKFCQLYPTTPEKIDISHQKKYEPILAKKLSLHFWLTNPPLPATNAQTPVKGQKSRYYNGFCRYPKEQYKEKNYLDKIDASRKFQLLHKISQKITKISFTPC
jgi:hypothetical protein